MSAITLYNSRVEYTDTAGSFGGWFLHRSRYAVSTPGHSDEVLARLMKMHPTGDGNFDFNCWTVAVTPAENENV